MDSYHGTSTAIATLLASGNIDVSLGGGELGRGFYTGEYLHCAKAWAFNIHGDRRQNVVRFTIDDNAYVAMNEMKIDAESAAFHRINIKRRNATRTHVFNVDVVHSPIVGNDKIHCTQYKWESAHAETSLNDPNVCAKVII